MDNKELRKLSRKELFEILLEQTKRIEELEVKLDRANKELNERNVSISNVGSLAEASLVLSNIFKSADEAASIYLENIKKLTEEESKKLKKKEKVIVKGSKKVIIKNIFSPPSYKSHTLSGTNDIQAIDNKQMAGRRLL